MRRDVERRALVACSGGADSTATLLALATTPAPLVVGHVAHDIRPEAEVRADAEHARALAASLGIPFVDAPVRVREGPGNLEARARRARYEALERMAGERACRLVVTGHHADDVLETSLMRLLRGTGARGLAGPLPSRPLGPHGLTLVRPGLLVSRADMLRICSLASLTPRHDVTNDDPSMLRNAIRARVVPVLKQLSPGVERRVARTAAHMRNIAAYLEGEAAAILGRAELAGPSIRLGRTLVRQVPEILLGEVVRGAVLQLGGGADLDRTGASTVGKVVRAARDGRGGRRTFKWGVQGRVTVLITADRVEISVEEGTDASEADRSRRTLRP